MLSLSHRTSAKLCYPSRLLCHVSVTFPTHLVRSFHHSSTYCSENLLNRSVDATSPSTTRLHSLNMPAPEDTPPTKSQQQHASARLPSSPTARLKEADPTWQAKLCLRALAAVLSLASASCFCTALFIWPERATSERFRRRYLIDMPTDDLPLFPVGPPPTISTLRAAPLVLPLLNSGLTMHNRIHWVGLE